MLIGSLRVSPPQTRTGLRQGEMMAEVVWLAVWATSSKGLASSVFLPFDRSSNDAVVGIIRSMEGEQGDSCVLQG